MIMLEPLKYWQKIYMSRSIKLIYLMLYPEDKEIDWIILFSYGFIIRIWFELPAINLCPNLEYLTDSQFFRGNWMLAGLNPYELIVNSFRPYLNPTATLNVKGWISRLDGESFWLKCIYHISILSNEVELKCSYLTAFIFLYLERISIIFLVGSIAISKISLTNSIHPRIDWIGDLRV